MNLITENINSIGGFALLIVAIALIWYTFEKLAHPRVRVLEVDAKAQHVHILILDNMNQLHVNLYGVRNNFEFENIKYYWNPLEKHPNEVFALCIEKDKRLVEILRIDFTSKDIKIPQYG